MAGHVHIYEADSKHGIHMWKAAVKFAGAAMMGSRPLLQEPVELRILWLFARPKRLLERGYQYRHLLYDGSKDVDKIGRAHV